MMLASLAIGGVCLQQDVWGFTASSLETESLETGLLLPDLARDGSSEISLFWSSIVCTRKFRSHRQHFRFVEVVCLQRCQNADELMSQLLLSTGHSAHGCPCLASVLHTIEGGDQDEGLTRYLKYTNDLWIFLQPCYTGLQSLTEFHQNDLLSDSPSAIYISAELLQLLAHWLAKTGNCHLGIPDKLQQMNTSSSYSNTHGNCSYYWTQRNWPNFISRSRTTFNITDWNNASWHYLHFSNN